MKKYKKTEVNTTLKNKVVTLKISFDTKEEAKTFFDKYSNDGLVLDTVTERLNGEIA